MNCRPHPDDIADCVLNTFYKLPPKFKPRVLGARHEWVPLAGIVLSRGPNYTLLKRTEPPLISADDESSPLQCVALATGMKCLPREKVPLAKGNVLHDWHAEILCLRAFNAWLIRECLELASHGRDAQTGDWIERNRQREGPPFNLDQNVNVHMFISSAPCGDASMELTMASQTDATPWTSDPGDDFLGRGNFDRLGVVRRKPARPDAPVSWSKSCSDKIAMKQCTGLLNAVSSLILKPCWLETLVMPESQCVSEAMERAFGRSGRMSGISEMEFFKPFTVKTTKREFAFSKEAAVAAGSPVSSNLAAMYTPHKQEVIVNGVLQGRKQTDAKGASWVSRRRMWESVNEVMDLLDSSPGSMALGKVTYGALKQSQVLEAREEVKRTVRELALKGWKQNAGNEDWALDDQVSIRE